MKKIVIGFSRPKAKFFPIYSWLIRLVQGIAFSHCYTRWFSESYDEPLVYEASGNQVRFVGSQAWENHVVVIHEFELEVTDQQFHDFVKFCMKTSGMPYSVSEVFGLAFVEIGRRFKTKWKNPVNDKRGWICSVLCGYLLVDVMKLVSNDDIKSAGPKEIYELVSKLPNARRMPV